MKALLLICCFGLLSVAVFAQNKKIDSLKRVIETTKVDTVRLQHQYAILKEYLILGMYSRALTLQKSLLYESQKRNYYNGIIKAYLLKGLLHYRKGEFIQAIHEYETGIKQAQKQNDQLNIATFQMNIGLMMFELGNFTQALDYLIRATTYFENTSEKINTSKCYNNLGLVYLELNNIVTAQRYFEKASKIFLQLNDREEYVNSIFNLAESYQTLKQHDKAIRLITTLLNEGKFDNKHHAEDAKLILANSYTQLDAHQKAIELYESCYKFYQQQDNRSNMAIVEINIAAPLFKLNDWGRAKIYTKRALEWALKSEDKITIVNAYSNLATIDSALGDYQAAYQHYKLFVHFKDSLFNEDKAKEFGRIESRYQFEKEAEEQKRKQAEAQRIAQEETDRRNNLQYLSIFGGLLVLFGGLAFVGKLKIPERVLDIALFAALLILFEFLLILFDPLLDQYTGGIPIQKLVFNSLIALGFAPLHGFLERKLKRRFSGASDK
jgi:tetratricopeptide (TPR) repeat protein